MQIRVLAATAATAFCALADAQVVTFESFAGAGNPIVTDIVSEGFRFTGEHFHTIDLFGSLVENGSSAYMGHEGSSLGRIITMTRADGGNFDLVAFDGAELWLEGQGAGFPNGSHIRVTGTFSGGGSISADFALDGLRDGAGGVDDFQNFVLSGFTGLSSATFNGIAVGASGDFAFAVDNINTVPAPASVAAFGLGALAAFRRRR